MKIILSRKGFDGQYGGIPSPIFDDIGPVSLPIPLPEGIELGSCLDDCGRELARVISNLGARGIDEKTLVHVDPDVSFSTLSRLPNWQPAFGQSEAAQGHLRNQKVGVGDLFLFFGWFQHVRQIGGAWRYDGPKAGFHALFGWLQVGEVIDVDQSVDIETERPWLACHPHVAFRHQMQGTGNTIYVARDTLTLEGNCIDGIAGAGRFKRWTDELRLSKAGATKSLWSIPNWMNPLGRDSSLTYHGNSARWEKTEAGLLLRTVGKGQEFVLDAKHYPEAVCWAKNLIERTAF